MATFNSYENILEVKELTNFIFYKEIEVKAVDGVIFHDTKAKNTRCRWGIWVREKYYLPIHSSINRKSWKNCRWRNLF